MRTNLTSCEMNCTANNGHIPYFYEAKSVLTELHKTINGTDFSLISEHLRDRGSSSFSPQNFQQVEFRISASFHFQRRSWISGGFRIRENTWAENQPRFPILNDRLNLVHKPNTGADHFGAVYCGDQLGEQDFKVRSRLKALFGNLSIFRCFHFHQMMTST